MAEKIIVKKGGIERRVAAADLGKWEAIGWKEVKTPASSQAEGKPYNKMNTAELEAAAAALGVTFPEDATTNPKRAAFLTEAATAKQE